jgi:hypothetical protein
MASNDPQFEQKAADIIGLYLNPQQHAAVSCVDEKNAIQALHRKDPVVPGPGVFKCLACLAHARPYYVKAQKVGESPSDRSLADIAIRDHIGELYKVEREIKALSERREESNQVLTRDEVRKIRQDKFAPIANALRQ